MRFDRCLTIPQSPSHRAPFAAAWVIFLVLTALPSFGYWLPWASEQDKIKKTLTEVWKALIDRDGRVLKNYLIGAGVAIFVEKEKEEIQVNQVKSYTIRILRVSLSPPTGIAGFVEFEKVAALKDGREKIFHTLAMVRKIGGVWRLVTDTQHRNQTLQTRKGDGATTSPGGQPTELILPSGRSLQSLEVPNE